MNLAEHLNRNLADIRRRRAEIEKDEAGVWNILKNGADRARNIASKTMLDVRKAMKVGWQSN
jgi:tryptophanyl-tRNA synthetase